MGVDDFGLGVLLETKPVSHIIGSDAGENLLCEHPVPVPLGLGLPFQGSLRECIRNGGWGGVGAGPCSTGPQPTGPWYRREAPPSSNCRRPHSPPEPVWRGEGLSPGSPSSRAAILATFALVKG